MAIGSIVHAQATIVVDPYGSDVIVDLGLISHLRVPRIYTTTGIFFFGLHLFFGLRFFE